MKKVLLVIFILIFSLSLTSQVIIDGVDINSEKGIEYCQIVGAQKFLSAKIIIYVDYGQKRKLLTSKKKFHLKDKDGKKVIFYSMVQALNFMYQNGWEFVHSYVITVNRGLKGKQNVYHYLLKRTKQQDPSKKTE